MTNDAPDALRHWMPRIARIPHWRTHLRTRLVLLGSRTSVDGEAADAWHDAMAAHALLQAMGEFHPSNEAARASFELATKRAAEILAGWMGEEAG